MLAVCTLLGVRALGHSNDRLHEFVSSNTAAVEAASELALLREKPPMVNDDDAADSGAALDPSIMRPTGTDARDESFERQ